MINNFWNFKYIIQRIGEKVEEYEIRVVKISGYKTSSMYPFCHSDGKRDHRCLFYYPKCRKAIMPMPSVLNITRRYETTMIPSPSWRDNGLVTQSLLPRWDEVGA